MKKTKQRITQTPREGTNDYPNRRVGTNDCDRWELLAFVVARGDTEPSPSCIGQRACAFTLAGKMGAQYCYKEVQENMDILIVFANLSAWKLLTAFQGILIFLLSQFIMAQEKYGT